VLALIAVALGAPVVAPMVDVAAYDRLEEGDLTLVDYPDALVHPQQITELSDAVGRIALEPLFAGEPLRAERLGDDARAVLLGDDHDLVLLTLPRPEHWQPGRVDLAVVLPEASCLLAQDLVSHGTSEPGLLALAAPAPLALALRWAVEEQAVVPLGRNPVDRTVRPELACAGGLPISGVSVPTGLGATVALPSPAAELVVSHPSRLSVQPVADGRVLWLHGGAPGRTALRADLAEGAPVVLAVTVDEERPAGRPVPPGGYVELGGEGAEVVAAHVHPPEAAEVVPVSGGVLVFARGQGQAEVLLEHPEGVSLHTLDILPGWPAPARGEPVLPLRVGQRRKISADGGVVEAWSADAEVAVVELRGKKARVQGVGQGTTEVIVQGPDGRRTHVRVVVP
jgi:hypothetical protein